MQNDRIQKPKSVDIIKPEPRGGGTRSDLPLPPPIQLITKQQAAWVDFIKPEEMPRTTTRKILHRKLKENTKKHSDP